MITTDINGRKALMIFENFVVDHTLPKYTTRKVEVSQTPRAGFTTINNVPSNFNNWPIADTGSGTNPMLITGMSSVQWVTSGTPNNIGEKSLPKKRGLKGFIDSLLGRTRTFYVRVTATPVHDIFEAIKGGGKKLEILDDRLEAHQAAIKEARAMGQTALAEQLEAETSYKETEAILVAAGYKEVITEEQLIGFIEKCEKGLAMDWVKNFTRLIPQDVRAKKTLMDVLNAFDNYVILHFDPLKKNSSLTKKEIEKKKDPILFGVVKGSRKLYHVASWKDEYCDLTFSDLVDKFGKKALKLK